MYFIKIIHEVLIMTEKLPDWRFTTLVRLFRGAVLVAGMYVLLFGMAALLSAIRWW